MAIQVPETKSKVFLIRQSLKRSETPTPKTIHWLCDTVMELLDFSNRNEDLVANADLQIRALKESLKATEEKVIEAVKTCFESLGK